MWRTILWAVVAACGATYSQADDLPLTVAEPVGVARQQWPVTSGIPFAEGALRDDRAVALYDAQGRELPLQTETLARWPDGSVRWLLLDFQIDLAAAEKKPLTLRHGRDVRRAAVERPVEAASNPDGLIVIKTGPLRLEYAPKMFMPQGAAWLTAAAGGALPEERVTINCGSDGVRLVDAHNRSYVGHGSAAHPAKLALEQAGPVRACLRAEGWHRGPDDSRMFRYVARMHAWRGQPYVRIFYTFINDHQDTLMARIKQLDLKFWKRLGGNSCLLDGKPVAEKSRLFQVDENQYQIDGGPAGSELGGDRLPAVRAGGRGPRVLAELAQGHQRPVARPARCRVVPRVARGPLRRQAAGGGKQAVLRVARRLVHVQGRRGQDARAVGELLPRPA
jgi:hypothetical protein